MSVTTHERPGVYSEYDASSVVQGRQGRKMVGMAAIHATAPAGVACLMVSLCLRLLLRPDAGDSALFHADFSVPELERFEF